MPFSTLEDLAGHPLFLSLLGAVLFTIGNIMVGVSILPRDRRKKGYWLHRGLYVLTLTAYLIFLWVYHGLRSVPPYNYAVLVYFLTAIPFSRRASEKTHAILASIGLVLLIGVAAFTLI
ncbi:MAG: hypothetical protein JSU88_04575 [Nitrospinaceae bacterium]|jgi:hypothetical protein|nr:MAG: hypothetical protein JSU88_04575 [Nitrospinaceae bacterium]